MTRDVVIPGIITGVGSDNFCEMIDLRGQLAALIGGVMPLDRFLEWYFANSNAIEFGGSDEDVALLNRVFHVYDDYTSGYIDASRFVDALRSDPLVQQELAARRVAVA